jgi:predicted negative regulator of RcsB-dependent stress response
VEVYTTDEERVEELKKWWKENGTSLITGVILGLGLLFGYRAWVDYQNNYAEQASAVFTQVQSEVQQNNLDKAQALTGSLISNWDSSPYAALSSLAIAKLNVERGDLASAQTQIQWALDHAKDDNLRTIARLRMARVLLAKGEPEAAEKLLATSNAGEFSAAYDEIRGDIYVKLGKAELARQAYQASLSKLLPNSQNRVLIQMKLDDLPVVEQGSQS